MADTPTPTVLLPEAEVARIVADLARQIAPVTDDETVARAYDKLVAHATATLMIFPPGERHGAERLVAAVRAQVEALYLETVKKLPKTASTATNRKN